MSGKKYLITGGCRSGKSRHALTLGASYSGKKFYLATAEAIDEEMSERITRHRNERDKNWITIEEPLDPGAVIKQEGTNSEIIVLDCLTIWISNLMHNKQDQNSIIKKADLLVADCLNSNSDIVLITNEVGAGIVPDNKLGRDFRDIAGEVNQRVAAKFDEVINMVSGIPTIIKSVVSEKKSFETEPS
jgi:adenosylcobinamide kinase/adenosylcobinamide-phosphate guanylyltransferase